MADDKEKSTDQILQAFDALSHLYQARATRRTTSLPLPRSGSAKDGGDAVDAAVEEARLRQRVRRRLSPRSPLWSKPKLDLNEIDDDEEGDGAALVVIIKSPSTAYPRMLPFRSRSKLDKKEDDYYEEEEEYDDDSAHSAATPEADGEKKGIMSYIGMRRMGCLFSVEVVAAHGLPLSMNGLRLVVIVRKKETRDGAVQTMPARVRLGAAEFNEALYIRCHLYGTGGSTTGKPLSFEPRPFLLYLIAINAPELDFGRSTVDLSLFAKEFTEGVRHWNMVLPLAGKAKGGELVVKLALQSIDDAGGAGSYSQRKLRRPSISNMLTPKMARTKTPKMEVSVPDPDLRGIDSFILNEPEPTPVAEVEETQPKELEREPTAVSEVKEEEQQKELECEPADELTSEPERESANEPTPVVEVKEEEQQKEPEHEPPDDLTSVAEVKEKEQQKEPTDETTPVTEVEEEKEEQQKELEREPADEPTSVAEVKEEEEEQQKEPEREPADEPTPMAEVKEEEEEQQKELECEQANEPTPVAEVKEDEQQKEPECDLTDEPTSVVEVKEEEEQKDLECEVADEPSPVAEVKEEEQQKELERGPADELTPVVEVEEEEQQKDLECEPTDDAIPMAKVKEEEIQKESERGPEDAQEDDDSEVPEFGVMDKDVEGHEVKAELKEEAEAKKGYEEVEEEASLVTGDEVATAVVNGLEEKSVKATMPSDMSNTVTDAMEPVNGEAAGPEEVTGESLQVPKQGDDKGAGAKPSRPRFKWRTVAVLVPLSVTVSKTLASMR